MTTYTELLTHYWPGAHWAKDAEIVNAEITSTFSRRPANNAELCAAVRWLAGPEWKGKGTPGLRELIMAVYVGRKAARQAESMPGTACGLCGNRGVVELWPGIHGKQESLDAYDVAYSLTVPCGCPAGKIQRGHEREHGGSTLTDDQFQARFEHARDQQGDRNRLAVAMHASTGFTVDEYVQRVAKTLPSEFDDMEIGP